MSTLLGRLPSERAISYLKGARELLSETLACRDSLCFHDYIDHLRAIICNKELNVNGQVVVGVALLKHRR